MADDKILGLEQDRRRRPGDRVLGHRSARHDGKQTLRIFGLDLGPDVLIDTGAVTGKVTRVGGAPQADYSLNPKDGEYVLSPDDHPLNKALAEKPPVAAWQWMVHRHGSGERGDVHSAPMGVWDRTRIFEIPLNVVETAGVAALERQEAVLKGAGNRKMRDLLLELAGDLDTIPVPDLSKLPFSAVFVYFGGKRGWGWTFTLDALEPQAPYALANSKPAQPIETDFINGMVLTREGDVWSCGWGRYTGQGDVPGGTRLVRDGAWTAEAHPTTMLCTYPLRLVLPAILEHITNDARSRVKAKRLERACRRARRGLKLPGDRPPEFYRINITPRRAREVTRRLAGTPAWSLTYRIDVAGHWRCLVKRGELPLAAETADKLMDRGYRVFMEGGDAEVPEIADHLRQRNIDPSGPGEWLAILAIWIKDHERGPEDAPHVRGIRGRDTTTS